jgi:hypothetical protein
MVHLADLPFPQAFFAFRVVQLRTPALRVASAAESKGKSGL